jgi:hypothetical protein
MSELSDICERWPERAKKLIHDEFVKSHSFNRTAKAFGMQYNHFHELLVRTGYYAELQELQGAFRARFEDPCGRPQK